MKRKLSLARIAPLSWMLLLAVVLATGCKDQLDLAKYTGEATALAQKYAPQLQELSGRLPELAKRAGDIPDSIPGAAALKGLLTKNKDAVAGLQGMIAGLGAKVAEQAKSGKPAEVKKLLETSSAELETGVATLRTELDTASAELTKAEAAAKAAAAPAGFASKLPSGVEIKGAADAGVESKLVAFLADPATAVDKTVWFNFDRISFQSGKAELEMEKSKDQLANITEILKAFPAAKIKIGGYTDNAGKPQDNKKLSQQRADAVTAALVAAGVDKARLEAEGYGVEHPECPANDTDDCKAKNRRIAVNVRAK